jgi:hypothetical protein
LPAGISATSTTPTFPDCAERVVFTDCDFSGVNLAESQHHASAYAVAHGLRLDGGLEA